jgi:hypothetical protein
MTMLKRMLHGSLIAIVIVVGMVLMSRSASAQLAANEVYAFTAFKIAGTHDGVNTTEYRLIRNSVQVATLPVTSLAAGEIVFDAAGLAIGSYTYRIDAAGPGGVTPSANLVVSVVAKPPAPAAVTVPRLIRIP